MYSIMIGGVNFENFINLSFVQELNQVSEASFEVFDLTTAQEEALALDSVVYIKRSNSLVELKGMVDSISYLDDSDSQKIKISGLGSLLLDRISNFPAETDGRKEWINTAGDTIIKELISGHLDEGTIDPLPIISFRAEYDTLLGVISGICKVCGVDWWIKEDITNKLYVGSKGSSTSQATLILGNDAYQDEADENTNDRFNVIYVFGYGDGRNQLKSVTFWATEARTFLSSSLSKDAITIAVEDGEKLPASGEIWIGMEECSFTRSGDILTLTRGVGEKAAYAHSAGIEVVDATYTIDDIESPKENRHTDRGIIDQDTLDRLAQKLLAKYHINGKKGGCYYYEEEADFVVGDQITIQHYDETTEIFRIIEKSYSEEDGCLFVKYITPGSFYQGDVVLTKNLDVNNPYGQGATNIFQIQSYENCDSSHPLHIRFRIPDDVVAINKVLLSFKKKPYRLYSKQVESDGDHNHRSYFNIASRNDAGADGEIVYLVGAIDKTFDMLVSGNSSSLSKSVSNSTTDVSHTHPIDLGIKEETLVNDLGITVKVGEDGTSLTELSASPFTSDQNEIDLIGYVGETGKWYDVEFTPAQVEGVDSNVRIEANVYVKVFVGSD